MATVLERRQNSKRSSLAKRIFGPKPLAIAIPCVLIEPTTMQERESTECCAGLQAKLDEWRECAEKTVREEPLKAAGYAFCAGIVCAVFPVGRCCGALLRLSFALLRPALFVLGLVRLFEEIDRRRESPRRDTQE
jgi:hypothetical protein